MSGPKLVQLTFGGGHIEARAKPRAGAIGKVQRLLDERPWLTCGEVAEAIGEPSCRVSECLNKLKHEGRAVRTERLGEQFRDVWASPESAGASRGVERLDELHRLARERRRVEAEQYHAKLARKHLGAEAGEVDWRPAETIPEDFYAL